MAVLLLDTHVIICVLFLFHSVEVLQLLDKEKNPEGPYLYYVFNSLLISLLVLHVYWWVLIWRMIVKQVQDRGKISDDVRSGMSSINTAFYTLVIYYQVCLSCKVEGLT